MTANSIEPAPTLAQYNGTTPAATAAEVDLSCRLPLLVLLASAAIWLVIGSVFALIASIKFHSPGFLADPAWLTYGRVRPVFYNSMLYGFCLQAGLGVALWIIARLSQSRLAYTGLAVVGAAFWNFGLTMGVLAILAGDSTGFEMLELPVYSTPLLFLGYLVIASCGVITFYRRSHRGEIFASVWFVLSALFWFPWIFSTAELLLCVFPVRGVAQSVIAWWYASNLQVVWMWLIGLGAIFYFLPRITAREFQNRYLALFTFWVVILFASWSGVPQRAPVPAWIPVLSTAGSVLSVLALVTAGLAVWKTLDGKLSTLTKVPSLRFFGFSTFSLLLGGLLFTLSSTFNVDRVVGLTWFIPAKVQINFYGFFAMAMFGAIYYLVPLVVTEQFSPRLVSLHFWLAGSGILLVALPLAAGGVLQGLNLQNPNIPFLDTARQALMFLRISTIGDLLLLVGHLVFLANVVGLFFRLYRALIAQRVEVATADLFKPEGARS